MSGALWWLLLSTLTCTTSLTNHPWHRRLAVTPPPSPTSNQPCEGRRRQKMRHVRVEGGGRVPRSTGDRLEGRRREEVGRRGGLVSMDGVCDTFRVLIWSPASTLSRALKCLIAGGKKSKKEAWKMHQTWKEEEEKEKKRQIQYLPGAGGLMRSEDQETCSSSEVWSVF